jgi:hypothetical protein
LYKPRSMKKYFIIPLLLLLLIGCERNNQLRISASQKKISDIQQTIDSSSIVGLYKFIFATRCNINGCHDGTFEPNFTTVESTYYTLVYHPINKNNSTHSYTYRVVPYDTSHSVLYARISNCCFVNKGDQMPQLNEQDKLSQKQILQVGKWIMTGAKNIDGQTLELKDSITK